MAQVKAASMVNDATRLPGLDGLVVERAELDVEGIPVVDVSTGCEQARRCPQCGQRAVRVKQWAAGSAGQRIRGSRQEVNTN